MRKFKFEQINSTPYKGLDGTVIFGDGTETNHKILVEAVKGLGIPQSIVQTQQAPFQVGSSPIRVTYGPRTISLECAIIVDTHTPTGVASMEAIKRDLGNKFSPVGMGYVQQTSLTTSNYSTITGKLSYASDGTTYDRFIDCVPISCEFPNRAYSDGFQRFRLALFCPDPTWYDAEQESVMTAVPSGASKVGYSVAYSESLRLYVAVAVSSPYVRSSYDGIVWTDGSLPSSCVLYSVVWSEYLQLFCAVGSTGTNRVFVSYDGLTWSGYVPAEANSWYKIAWSEELRIFVAVSFDGTNRVMTSTNGTSWTSVSVQLNSWLDVKWAKELGIFVAVSSNGTNRVMTSTNGTSWTNQTAASVSAWSCVEWSAELSRLTAIASASGGATMYSANGVSWTSGTAVTTPGNYDNIVWAKSFNRFIASSNSNNFLLYSSDGITWGSVSAPVQAWIGLVYVHTRGTLLAMPTIVGEFPAVSYDGSSFYYQQAGDYYKVITNSGDVPTEFEIDIPLVGGETSKKIAISDNFLWDGTGTPPSDHNLVFGTDGLKKGTVTVSTKFNAKDITQFGVSKFNLYQQGTFFSLYVSGATTNNIYVRNTGTAAGAPTIRWKNRYLGV